MQCLRCGREITEDQVFCSGCLDMMQQHPVKPNTVVTIPERPARIRAANPRKPVRIEDNSVQLRRTILQLRLWVCLLMAALMICVAFLTWQELSQPPEPSIGQNYTSIIEYPRGGR